MTVLAFSNRVASSCIGCTTEEIERVLDPEHESDSVVGVDVAAIKELIEAITQSVMTILQGCPQRRNDLKTSIKEPGRLQRVAVRMETRSCCRGTEWEREWRSIADQIIQCGCDCCDDDEALVDDVITESSTRFWLI